MAFKLQAILAILLSARVAVGKKEEKMTGDGLQEAETNLGYLKTIKGLLRLGKETEKMAAVQELIEELEYIISEHKSVSDDSEEQLWWTKGSVIAQPISMSLPKSDDQPETEERGDSNSGEHEETSDLPPSDMAEESITQSTHTERLRGSPLSEELRDESEGETAVSRSLVTMVNLRDVSTGVVKKISLSPVSTLASIIPTVVVDGPFVLQSNGDCSMTGDVSYLPPVAAHEYPSPRKIKVEGTIGEGENLIKWAVEDENQENRNLMRIQLVTQVEDDFVAKHCAEIIPAGYESQGESEFGTNHFMKERARSRPAFDEFDASSVS